VKRLHDFTCQICGTQLSTPAGGYPETCHIKPLGRPHNGPDVSESILCLCPNCHVLLDELAVWINDDLSVEGVSLLRPGGTIVLQDVDDISYNVCTSASVMDCLARCVSRCIPCEWRNAYVGRDLVGHLRAADIKNIRVKIHVGTVNPGEYRRKNLLSLLEILDDKVIDCGVLTEKQLSNHREALLAHLKNPDTLLIDKLLVQAWGQE
jgi:hypothetical protein